MSEPSGEFCARSLSGVDPVIHAPARLALVTQLYVVEAADATFLVNQTGLTWGNFSTHVARLEESGYVAVEKSFRGRKPHTMIRLTSEGRAAFRKYRSEVQRALEALPE